MWNGINNRGRDLIAAMNELGILIDITHAAPQAQRLIIAASTKPVVCSHTAMKAVSGTGMDDDLLKALCAKGGMVGIIGTSSSLSRGYHNWLAANPDKAKAQVTPTMNMVGFRSPLTPGPLTHGEFGAWLDAEMRRRHYAAFQPWADDSDTPDVIANADDWAAHAAHVVHTVGAAHVGIGLDMVGGRSCVPRDATGYPALLAAISRRMNAADVERVAQANWLRILGDVL